MLSAETFLSRIETYLSDAQMSATAFGRLAVRDPNFVFDLRKGRMPNLGLVEQVANFIHANPPQPAPSPTQPERVAS